METLNWRLSTAQKALKTLNKLVGLKHPTAEKRDAAIQRFEYTFESIWKASQRYLLEKEGISVASPKACIRASKDVGLLNDSDAVLGLKMVDDRNLTSHTYNETIAKNLYKNLSTYSSLMQKWLQEINEPKDE